MPRCNYPRCRRPSDMAWMGKHLCTDHYEMGSVRLANALGVRLNRPACPVCSQPTEHVYWPASGPVPGLCDACSAYVLEVMRRRREACPTSSH